jgi:hypothetical protein
MASLMLNNPSREQQIIIDQVQNNNVVVDAVAGSGKTTTILHIGLRYPKLRILVVTYNTKLRQETLAKINTYKIHNIEIQTYHGFCVKYYNDQCRTDNEISKILRYNTTLKKTVQYDLLIIDEAQDMTPMYFELICKIIKDNSSVKNICVLGDKYQSIFNFNNADFRFITEAHQVFNFTALPWLKYELNTSYRMTNQMATFMNKCVLQENRICASKQGALVKYIICNTFDDSVASFSYREIIKYLIKYSNEDIFVLAPSVKSIQSPIRILANKLTTVGIPIYVPNNDNEKIDEDVIKGKIVFSTFHQVKGLERKVVVVFGITDKYFTFYDRNSNPKKCSNAIYVALSRAQECMTILHHYQDNYCQFINQKELRKNTEFIEDPKYRLKVHNTNTKEIKEFGVTELLRHLPFQVIEHAISYLKITEHQKQSNRINVDTKVKQNNYYENVSEITGTAIPAYFEYLNKGSMEILKVLNLELGEDLNYPNTPDELLQLANKYCAFMGGYNYKLAQITNYNWLTCDTLLKCTDRVAQQISNNATFEKKLTYRDNATLIANYKKLVGVIDCIDNNKVWEFKCVTLLDNTYILQLAIYAFMLLEDKRKKKLEIIEEIKEYSVATYNFLDGESITFEYNDIVYKGIIVKIFKNGKLNVRSNDKTFKITKGNILKINAVDKFISQLQEIEMPYEFYLFNILDNQILKIDASYEAFKEMTEYLIMSKYEPNTVTSNEEFLGRINMIKNKYFNTEYIQPLQYLDRNKTIKNYCFNDSDDDDDDKNDEYNNSNMNQIARDYCFDNSDDEELYDYN